MATIAKVCGHLFQDIHTMTIDKKYVMMYVITSYCKSKNCQRMAKQARVVSSMDWIGFTSGYRVATALRIVYWPSLSLLGGDASRSVRLFQLTIPPKVTICRESIIMLFDGKCNLVTRATLHNSYEFKVVKSLPESRVCT